MPNNEKDSEQNFIFYSCYEIQTPVTWSFPIFYFFWKAKTEISQVKLISNITVK
jgi:hypothetical protein